MDLLECLTLQSFWTGGLNWCCYIQYSKSQIPQIIPINVLYLEWPYLHTKHKHSSSMSVGKIRLHLSMTGLDSGVQDHLTLSRPDHQQDPSARPPNDSTVPCYTLWSTVTTLPDTALFSFCRPDLIFFCSIPLIFTIMQNNVPELQEWPIQCLSHLTFLVKFLSTLTLLKQTLIVLWI